MEQGGASGRGALLRTRRPWPRQGDQCGALVRRFAGLDAHARLARHRQIAHRRPASSVMCRSIRFRKSLGVTPVAWRNADAKLDGEENPSEPAMALMLSSVASLRFAVSIRLWATWSRTEKPRLIRK